MKKLQKDYDVVAKRFRVAKKATDDALRSAATKQDKEVIDQIEALKKQY